jgi:prephenate dehydrogenase
LQKIAIYGLGLIGGSLAKAFKQSNVETHISAFDRTEVLNTALAERTIDETIKDATSTDNFDVIFLCLPVETSLEYFKLIAPLLGSNQILTDVCGVKSIFAKSWTEIESAGIYIGGHPMTGKEQGGYENSDPLLFENSIYVLTEDLNKNEDLTGFRSLVEALGANILYIPAHQHDVIAASVSHMPQLLSVALVNTAALKTEDYNFLDLAAGGFRDMTRIASSDFEIWESVIRNNKEEILAALESFTHELESISRLLGKEEFSSIKSMFDSARHKRHQIPANTKGFLAPLYDLFVFVKDEPGVISKISTELYKLDINIKDIELLKIREGSGGTFRLSFETEDDRKKAAEAILKIGFVTSE